MIRRICTVGLPVFCLVACEPAAGTGPDAAPRTAAGARADGCWASETTPAIVESVSEQVLIRPATHDAEGGVVTPAAYRTETRQRIVRPRRDIRFRTPCAAALDAAFIATLQRALTARGLYRGVATGVMDTPTRRAIRRFQEPRGLASGTLSLETARALGLVVHDTVDGRTTTPAG